MKLLSRAEEILLIAIIRLEENAYSITINTKVSEMSGYDWPYGAVYVPLCKLVKREYVTLTKTAPAKVQGGKSKAMYKISPKGLKALNDMNNINNVIWDGIPSFVKKNLK